ncbi:MAG: tetratricopeptide repeat protein [Myxococcota bacterium]
MTNECGLWGLLAAVFCAVFAFSTTAAAQSSDAEYVEPTERQLELNDAALSHMNDGEYAKAASLMQESLHIGPLNVTYLNLGRSYQKMDRCKDARAALEKVESAPKLRSPEPEFVEKKAQDYLAEIGESGCADALDDEPLGTAIDLPAEGGRATLGWVSIGAGAALIGVGVLFQLQAAGLRDDIRSVDADQNGVTDDFTRATAIDKKNQANTFSTLAASTGAAGLIFAGIGGYLLATQPAERASKLHLHVGPGSGRVVWTLRF